MCIFEEVKMKRITEIKRNAATTDGSFLPSGYTEKFV